MEFSDRNMSLALYALGRRMMSAGEMKAYLIKKEVSGEEIEAILARLREMGYLNDEIFAEAFVRSRLAKGGRRKIAWELKQKGVDSEIIRAVIDAVDVETETAAATEYARRALRGETDYKAKNRAYAALFRRGYGGEAAREAVETALDEAKEAQKEAEEPEYFEDDE